MLQQNEEVVPLIVAGTIMLLLLGIFIVGFLFLYQKRHNRYIEEKQLLENVLKQEMLKSKIEIQEQTLAHISQEIHDNIGQVLSFVKLNLNTAHLNESEKQERVDESRELLTQAIGDLRDLSRSFSYEQIVSGGLMQAIRNEVTKLERSGLVRVYFAIQGEIVNLGEQCELVLFRIFQESVNNILKHSGSEVIRIDLQYSPELFILILEDEGSGFLPETVESHGSGLMNIRNRGTLIGADVSIRSQPGAGCTVKIALDLPLANC